MSPALSRDLHYLIWAMILCNGASVVVIAISCYIAGKEEDDDDDPSMVG